MIRNDIKKAFHFFVRSIFFLVFTVLVGCQSMPVVEDGPGNAPAMSAYSFIPLNKLNTMPRKMAAEGIKALDENRLAYASDRFSRALKMDITNPNLHFLNALTYHIRAQQGESQYYALAEQGYKLAIRFDNTNWLSFYYLGQLYYDQRQFPQARDEFARAVMLNPDDRGLLYHLVAAAYYSHDPLVAEAGISHLRKLYARSGASTPERLKLARISALNKAALNDQASADAYLRQYGAFKAGELPLRKLQARLQDWKLAYSSAAVAYKVADNSAGYGPSPPPPTTGSSSTGNTDSSTSTSSDNTGSGSSSGNFVDDQMVVVDVVIIGTVEDTTTSMGVNLLSGLQLQFGNKLDGSAAFSTVRTRSVDAKFPANDTDTKTLINNINIPAVRYSLNIANAQEGKSEVLAKPTLVARSGQKSEFFSGVEVSGAATSGGAGDSVSVNKEIGVKLSVTPEIAPNNTVLLNVTAERTFLTSPSSSVLFTFRLDTTKTVVNANVAMKFGQTLILSGLSERETSSNNDGVPLLKDIPILKMAFSNKTTRNYDKSVIILLTPRRASTALYQQKKLADKKQGHLGYYNGVLSRLQQRHPDWFSTEPSYNEMIKKLNRSALYQEFRSGDIVIPDSDKQGSLRRKYIGEAVSFLFQ